MILYCGPTSTTVSIPSINANTGVDYYDIYLPLGNPHFYKLDLRTFESSNTYCPMTEISVVPIAGGSLNDFLSSDTVTSVTRTSALESVNLKASIPASNSFTYFYEFRFKGVAS